MRKSKNLKLKKKNLLTKKSTRVLKSSAKVKEQLVQLKRQAFAAERMRFEKSRESLIRAKNQMALLAAGVGHEFNNILGAIDGHAEWALSSGSLQDMTEALEVARVACARSAQITRALQGLAQVDEESYELVNAGSFFDEITRLVAGELKLSSIDFSRQNELKNPKVFYGSKSRLTEVLVNLVRNAMDEVLLLPPQMQKTVSLSLFVKKSRLIFSVEDSGRGIDQNISDLIFQPFFTTKGVLQSMQPQSAEISGEKHTDALTVGAEAPQSEELKSMPRGGSGLGLYLSKAIAEDHGGSLLCSASKLLGGACFELSLPVAAKR